MDGATKQMTIDPDSVQEITRLLGLEDADTTATLMPIIYDELRRLAAYRLSLEKPGQTLQATALVNEVYLRLVKDSDVHWENKRHFFGAAAEAMRRILIENARKKKSLKRGGEWRRTEMDVAEIGTDGVSDEVLQVHEVLDQFGEIDPESAELVKLRFFAGLTLAQCAEVLGISERTADNRWAFARTWLIRAIQERD